MPESDWENHSSRSFKNLMQFNVNNVLSYAAKREGMTILNCPALIFMQHTNWHSLKSECHRRSVYNTEKMHFWQGKYKNMHDQRAAVCPDIWLDRTPVTNVLVQK